MTYKIETNTKENADAPASLVERLVSHDGKWLHKNGQTHKVLYIANRHIDEDKRDEYPLLVVYIGEDNQVWAETIEMFLRSRKEKPNECCVWKHGEPTQRRFLWLSLQLR